MSRGQWREAETDVKLATLAGREYDARVGSG